MKRWKLKAGLLLLGWCPVRADIELETSVGTISMLLEGDLDEELRHHVSDRARRLFFTTKPFPIDKYV